MIILNWDHELDVAIARLVAASVGDAPPPPELEQLTSPTAAPPSRPSRRRWVPLAVAVVLGLSIVAGVVVGGRRNGRPTMQPAAPTSKLPGMSNVEEGACKGHAKEDQKW